MNRKSVRQKIIIIFVFHMLVCVGLSSGGTPLLGQRESSFAPIQPAGSQKQRWKRYVPLFGGLAVLIFLGKNLMNTKKGPDPSPLPPPLPDTSPLPPPLTEDILYPELQEGGGLVRLEDNTRNNVELDMYFIQYSEVLKARQSGPWQAVDGIVVNTEEIPATCVMSALYLAAIGTKIMQAYPDSFEQQLEAFGALLVDGRVTDKRLLALRECLENDLNSLIEAIDYYGITSSSFVSKSVENESSFLRVCGVSVKDLTEQAHLYVVAYYDLERARQKSEFELYQRPEARALDPLYDFKSHLMLRAARMLPGAGVGFSINMQQLILIYLGHRYDARKAHNVYRLYYKFWKK